MPRRDRIPTTAGSSIRSTARPIFCTASRTFAISIALERDGEIVAGLVYDPVRDEMYSAEKGLGAYVNDRRLRVSARRRLAEAVIGTGMPFGDRGDRPVYLASLAAVMAATSGVRRIGAAALDLAYVAAGRFEGFWEFGLAPWDIAAGFLLVREAGGYVSDLSGGHAMMTSGDVLAANDHLHLPLAALIRDAMRSLTGRQPNSNTPGNLAARDWAHPTKSVASNSMIVSAGDRVWGWRWKCASCSAGLPRLRTR